MDLRKATPADADGIAQAHVQAWKGAYGVPGWALGRAPGCAMAPDPPTQRIDHLLGRGRRGRCRLRELWRVPRSRRLCRYLPNAPAVRLYESLGFVATGVEPEVVNLHGVFHDIQHMSLRHA